jgi:hypothetical protein
MIKLFESYILSESLSDGNFYDLFGKTVYVYDTEYSGGEYIIFYENEDGTKNEYRDTLREIQQDFVRTEKSFTLNVNKAPKTKLKPKSKPKSKSNKPEFFNIVFYMGTKKLETIQANVHKTKAYPLKGYFQKLDKYRRGTVKVEPIISKKRFESINNEEFYTLEYLTDNLTTVNMEKLIDATKECQYGWVIEEQKASSTKRAGEDLSNKYNLNGVVGEWVYPFNSPSYSNESLCFGLKELLKEDNRYSVEIDKLYESYLKLNPTIKDIPIKDSFDKYEVMLGMTSGYNFDDIYDWIVIGSAPSRDDNYRSLKNELQTIVGHVGYVPSEKTIRNILNQL